MKTEIPVKFEITAKRIEETLNYYVEDAKKEFASGKRNKVTVYRERNSEITSIELLFYGDEGVRSICSKYVSLLKDYYYQSLNSSEITHLSQLV